MNPEQLKNQYGLTELEIQKVLCLKELLGDDTDGVYAMLQDEGIYIEYEDLEEIK